MMELILKIIKLIGASLFSFAITYFIYYYLLQMIYKKIYVKELKKFALDPQLQTDFIFAQKPYSLLLKSTHIYTLLLGILLFLYTPRYTFLVIVFLIVETFSATCFKKG